MLFLKKAVFPVCLQKQVAFFRSGNRCGQWGGFIKMSSNIQQLQLSTEIQPKPSPLNELECIRKHQTGIKCGVETFRDPSSGVSHSSTGSGGEAPQSQRRSPE